MSNSKTGKTPTRFVRGSGNVFADLGLPDPEDALARVRLAEAISDTIERRGLTQTQAAEAMEVDQPKVSLIVNGRLDGFTQDRLMRYLTALGDDVQIIVRHPRAYDPVEKGHLSVTVA